ncbi:MAG: hypothetical protein H6631_09340 [Anaerolineaceae bacterium]|nr:hypothetical protein [Anaerolineaceae bacterium]
MPTLRFEQQTPYKLRSLTKHETPKIIALAKAFVAREELLPPQQRTPYTDTISQLLAQTQTLIHTNSRSENQRTKASEALKRLDEQLNSTIEQIMATLKATFLHNLEVAQEWGFELRQKTGNIRKPKERNQRLAALAAYISKEQSRPPEEQFARPALDEVVALYDKLQRNKATRDAGEATRMQSRVDNLAVAEALYNTLQLALHHIVWRDYNSTLAPGLREWGFDVIYRQRRAAANGDSPAGDSEAAVQTGSTTPTADSATTNGSTTTNGDGSTTNGTTAIKINPRPL